MKFVSPSRFNIAVALEAAAMLIIAVAGAAKLLDLEQFSRDTNAWTAFPVILRRIAVVIVPTAEVGIPTLWLLNFRAMACRAGIALLVSISSALIIQSLRGGVPECHCLGALTKYVTVMRSLWWHFWFNIALIASLVGAIALRRGDLARVAPRRTLTRHRVPPGFTLVECLVIVAIVTIIASLSVPIILSSRRAATDLIVVSRLQQHTAIISQYSADYTETWPRAPLDASLPGLGQTSIDMGVFGSLDCGYFEFHAVWPALLAPGYYDGNFWHPSFGLRGWPPGPATPFHYSPVFLADPKYWNQETRVGPSQWRATHVSEVDFPSSKSLLIDWVFLTPSENAIGGSPRGARTVALALVDGSARRSPENLLRPGYPRGDGPWPGGFFSFARPAMHTIDGVRGRDIP